MIRGPDCVVVPAVSPSLDEEDSLYDDPLLGHFVVCSFASCAGSSTMFRKFDSNKRKMERAVVLP